MKYSVQKAVAGWAAAFLIGKYCYAASAGG
jgi:hypothetical protein